jgi:hypothetical protein
MRLTRRVAPAFLWGWKCECRPVGARLTGTRNGAQRPQWLLGRVAAGVASQVPDGCLGRVLKGSPRSTSAGGMAPAQSQRNSARTAVEQCTERVVLSAWRQPWPVCLWQAIPSLPPVHPFCRWTGARPRPISTSGQTPKIPVDTPLPSPLVALSESDSKSSASCLLGRCSVRGESCETRGMSDGTKSGEPWAVRLYEALGASLITAILLSRVA